MKKNLSDGKPTNDKSARIELANGMYATRDQYNYYVWDPNRKNPMSRPHDRYPHPNHAFVGTAISLKNAKEIASKQAVLTVAGQ